MRERTLRTWSGEQWKNAYLFGARLTQKLGRFELGLGLVSQLDSPTVLPAGAAMGDYASTYGLGTLGGTF